MAGIELLQFYCMYKNEMNYLTDKRQSVLRLRNPGKLRLNRFISQMSK